MQISKASIFTFFTIALLFFSLYSCIKVKEKPDIIPTSVVLTKVEINECKDKYGSNYFDFGSDVDPFIILSDNSFINDLINEENNYKIDVSESQFPVGWDVNVSMPSLSEAYIISCYDYDPPPDYDQLVGSIYFKLSVPTVKSLPFKNTQVVQSGNLKFTLHLTWNK